ncbi:MAG: HlyD family efflux transporter periplasmic adaptor subunit [Burkholderiaceae bacterium]|nr:HlyD family efflux transporter periplasmic adaptor subunit [Burkholderiaceae bacterium]
MLQGNSLLQNIKSSLISSITIEELSKIYRPNMKLDPSWLRKWQFWLAAGAITLAVIVGLLFIFSGNSGPAYKTAKAEKGAVTATVSASGTLNAVVSVQVGSQISGQIKELFADFNSEVKEGQLIARIDPETFEYKVRQAQADLDAARAQIMMQRAEATRYQVNAVNAKRDYERNQQLYEKGFISIGARDTSHTNYSALAEQAKSAQAQVAVTEAGLKQKQAVLAQAKIDLGRTAIRAPVNGVVVKRSVDRGQTVAASLQSPELFVIAENLADMQVDTSIDEAEIGRVREGQKATFTVDAFPGRTFEGTVKRIRKSAQIASNVVTYLVEIATSNPDKELLPGMTANVRIVTDTREDVLRVPNAALRFRPAGTSTKAAAAGGNAGAAQMKAQRERLEKELQLNDEQKTKLDGIFNAMRQKMGAARQAQEAERKKLIERARTEMNAQIAEMLTPEQKAKFDEINAEASSRRQGGGTTAGRIYVMENGRPKELAVRVGLTDGTMTEVFAPELKEGTEVIVGTVQKQSGSTNAAPPAGPRMF